MDQVLSGRLSVAEFCARYEKAWNFERDESQMSERDARIFEQVFDSVAWYTPIVEDRRASGRFKSEADILGEIERHREELR
jgi:hypothetical protein